MIGVAVVYGFIIGANTVEPVTITEFRYIEKEVGVQVEVEKIVEVKAECDNETNTAITDITTDSTTNADTSNSDNTTRSNDYKTFEVTAYTAGYESTGKTPGDAGYGITASGSTVQSGHTIACAPSRPFGTRVYIPYFDTTFTCEDRGGAITKGKIDVYMDNVEDARQFGRRTLEVKILN